LTLTQIKRLDEVANVNYGTRVTRKRDGGTIYPVYGGGGETFRLDTYNREDCTIVSRFAMSEECVRFVEGKFFLNDSGLTVETKTEALLQEYLDKFLFSQMRKIYSLGRGTAQKNLESDAFKKMEIPVPSLERQREIVEKVSEMQIIILEIRNSFVRKQQILNELNESVLEAAFFDEVPNGVE
jgi:restriction endonuclease S subunit